MIANLPLSLFLLDTIVHHDDNFSNNDGLHTSSAAATGATTPSLTLSPKPQPANPSLRLSASTLGGTSLSTIQRENQATGTGGGGGGGGGGEVTGSKLVSHTPRTPRNLLQSFLNIDTNRAAVLQLVS